MYENNQNMHTLSIFKEKHDVYQTLNCVKNVVRFTGYVVILPFASCNKQ